MYPMHRNVLIDEVNGLNCWLHAPQASNVVIVRCMCAVIYLAEGDITNYFAAINFIVLLQDFFVL